MNRDHIYLRELYFTIMAPIEFVDSVEFLIDKLHYLIEEGKTEEAEIVASQIRQIETT